MTRTLLTLCFSTLALSACTGERIRVNAPPPPKEWLVCAPEPARPQLPGLTPLGEHYSKPQVDARDSAIARYVLDLRAAWFDCSVKLGKVRTYHEKAD